MVFSFSEVAISRLLVLNQPNDNESSASLNVGYLENGDSGWVDVDLRMGFGWENLPGKTELQNGNAKSHPWNLEFDVFFDFFVEVSSRASKERWGL